MVRSVKIYEDIEVHILLLLYSTSDHQNLIICIVFRPSPIPERPVQVPKGFLEIFWSMWSSYAAAVQLYKRGSLRFLIHLEIT